jgi:hypothetical protein
MPVHDIHRAIEKFCQCRRVVRLWLRLLFFPAGDQVLRNAGLTSEGKLCRDIVTDPQRFDLVSPFLRGTGEGKCTHDGIPHSIELQRLCKHAMFKCNVVKIFIRGALC